VNKIIPDVSIQSGGNTTFNATNILHMKIFYSISFLLLLFFSSYFSEGQGKFLKAPDDKVAGMEANRKTEAPFSVLFKENAAFSMADAQRLFSKYLTLRQGLDELRFLRSDNASEVVTNRYQQYFKGIKVEHGTYIVAGKNDHVSYITGDFYTINAGTSIIPILTEAAARTRAWQFMDGIEPVDPNNSTAELVFVENGLQPGEPDGKVKLAYKIFIDSRTKSLTHEDVYVDAENGQILFTNSLINKSCYQPGKQSDLSIEKKNAATNEFININPPLDVSALAASIYSGTLTNMVTRFVSGTYRLEATLATELYPNHTRSVNHALVSGFTTVSQFNAAITASTEVTDADNNWTAAEYNNANFDNTALDVHWGAQRVYDYWKTRHNRNSWDGSNGILNCFVHGDNNWNNAFWQGSGGINSMFYGDGSNTVGGFSTLTSLDVTGHEIGHGVCQSTSNLTYSNQSGAMNEGFSDIWGASIEHFGDPHEVDATAKSYFDIGEEITVGGGALRSMSNPKLYGQPDTYLQTNWYTGAADNGGVHTNSGVLNYWFYLLVTGKIGTNDLGNAYNVPAIGWVDAEKITFLGETSLTASATYTACRTAMINAATTLFGACSLQTETVTRAWYAVGVGVDFVPCTPQVMFNGVSQVVTEAGAAGGATCLKTKTITVPVKITSGATQPASVSFSLSGTASNGATFDYTISPTTVIFPAASTTDQNLTITVNNDAYIEGDETIILNINTVTTTGNAVKGNIYQQYSITITDDDYSPASAVVQSNQTIYSENFTTPGTWTSSNSAGAVNIWRLGNNAGTTTPFGSANNCAYISQNTTAFTYNLTASGSSRLESPSISTLNTSNLQLSFDYLCNGEIFSGIYYDYGSLWYSVDGGTNWLQTNLIKYQGTSTKTSITVPLPSTANNVADLKIGFRWDNDNSAGTQPPYGIDNIVLKGDKRIPASIQTTVNSGSSSDQEYLGPNATVHFYDKVSGNIMGTIENLTSWDYGCTTMEVDRAGTAAQYIIGDISGNAKQKLSDKTFRVIPANNSVSGDYRITLYYSAAEKAGYEAASTRVWLADNGSNNGTKITKHSGSISTLSTATSGVFSLIESIGTLGTDYSITGQFSGGFSGFAAGIPPSVILPVSLVNFTGVKNNTGVLLSWDVAQQLSIKNYIVEYSSDGRRFETAGIVSASQLSIDRYNFQHLYPVAGNNFYRLKIISDNGSYKYSVTIRINLSSKNNLEITPNPVQNNFTIQYTNNSKIKQLTIFDYKGSVVKYITAQGLTGSVNVNAGSFVPGVYIVKMIDNNNQVITEKFVKE
jgi:Zn-dependent metalloprotease